MKKMNIWESAMNMAEAPAPQEVTLTFSPQEIDVLGEVMAQFQDKLKGMGPEDKKAYEMIQKKIMSRKPRPDAPA